MEFVRDNCFYDFLWLSLNRRGFLNGNFPAYHTVTDPIGREIYSIHYVASDEIGNAASGYHAQTNATTYPSGTDNYRIAINSTGNAVTNITNCSSNFDITYNRGIKTNVTDVPGGATTTRQEWADPVSGIDHVKETMTESETQPDGCERRTSYVKYDYKDWLTQSVTTSDFLGRVVASSRVGVGGEMLTTSNVYNNEGLLVQTVNHDGSSVVYAYNELNERTATISIAAGQTLDFDPLSFTLANVVLLDKYVINLTTESTENTEGEWWRNNETILYKPGENALTTSVQMVQLTGLSQACNSRVVAVDADENTTEITESINSANASKVVTSVNTTLGITNVSCSVAGYETCSSNSLSGVTEHLYDGFARRVRTANYANGRELKSVTTYHDDGSLATVGEVTISGTNTTSYSTQQVVADKLGAYKITVTDAKGNQTVDYYSGNGQRYRSEGATYPTETARDASGRMSQLHTWRDETGNSDITRWYYDLFTGAVTNKFYADGKGTAYTYRDDGRISTRKWARNIITTYGYADTDTGSIRTTDYNDDTPSATNYYNLAGQLVKVEDGTGTITFGYDSKGRLIAETNAFAVITRSYDTFGRYIQFMLQPLNPAYPCQTIRYGYDVFNRLNILTAIIGTETNVFTYSYLSGTQLISGYTATTPATGTTNFIVTRTYEPNRNLISAVTNSFLGPVPSVVSSFNYSNDSIGQRTRRTDYFDGSTVFNTFGYNERREVTNAVMNSDEQNIVYDDIGNREQSTVYSRQSTVTNVYTANQLNQYSSICNSQFSIPYSPAHDLDGNLTWDGQKWHHSWDGENRLISSKPDYWGTTNGACMFNYHYNHKSLRVEKIKKQLSGREVGYPMNPQADPGTWNPVETRKYIWDGFNIAVEIIIDHAISATNISYYTWGLDLSGTLQSAGGVGGLLCDTKTSSTETNTYFAVGDANGNITEYVDVLGITVAHGEHNSFGETELSGSMNDDFTHWFSTKPFDKKTRLVQYQYRPYDAPNAKFISSDPIGEAGGYNLYLLGNNDAISKWDKLGLKWKITRGEYNWAVAHPTSDSDTFEQLASQIRLEHHERTKWLKKPGGKEFVIASDKAKKGCRYGIPNVMAVYTSKSGIGDGVAMTVTQLKRISESNGDRYAAKGYKVVRKLWNSSSDVFIDLWQLDGIVAISFAGHGNKYGFKVGSWGSDTVNPGEVFPPYKLQGIGAYSCLSDRDIIGNSTDKNGVWVTHRWKDNLSNNGGTYVGYSGYVNWISALWNEISINAGDIPE
ncbi:MAG: hypothetical protein PHY48_12315 [Candidatus Cloacimonetes bacterium]|nr:hypothetical protein [Candidatus Cloacimonadota bacterium]